MLPIYMSRLPSLHLLLCLALSIASLEAQIVSGAIVGSVKDTSGAAVPRVRVVVRNTETNLSRETLSSDSGDFTLPALPPGNYQVTASRAGFKSEVVANIQLLIAQTVRADLKLEVGQITEQVTVQGSAVLLETDTPTIVRHERKGPRRAQCV